MASGDQGSKKAMAYGKGSKEIPILVSGRTLRPMVMECTLGRMVIGMKVSGSNA